MGGDFNTKGRRRKRKNRESEKAETGKLDPFYRRQRRERSGKTSKSRNTESGNRKTVAASASEWLKAESGGTGKAMENRETWKP
jgi:hypothetical protein